MSDPDTSSDRYIGQLLGGTYRIASVLGRGGMGTVYSAEHVETGVRAAVKTLLPELNESPELRSRFQREGHASGFLGHPHVVEVYEMGTASDGTLYLAMELVEGQSLAELLRRGALHPRRALVITRQALLGLGYAHQHGLVHRDMKPDNIMVAQVDAPGGGHEHVKLLDFGVVKLLADAADLFGAEKLTQTGVTFGTPGYMAPEQALGRAIDIRADLYSMGAILFEMLTGRPPFVNHDSMALLRMHITRPPPTLASVVPAGAWCTSELETLVATSLAKQPEQRYADARAMITALDAAFLSIDHLPNAAT